MLGDTLTEGDKAVVRAIAGLCPMIGGTAVFKARFLYGYFAVPGFDDEKLCTLPTGGGQIGGKIASNSNSNNADFSIYPNPAYDELFIQTTANEPVTLILMDITGKKVAEQNFTNSTQLSISHLPNGAYFCEIWKGEQKIGTQKLSVIH